MTYTKNNPNKFFLNDKNIAQELNYGDIQLNAIPSLDLVSSLYNQLSTEDKRQNDYIVSVKLSAYTISSNVDNRLQQLSNVLSTYSNKLCSNISSQIDENRKHDKNELSLILSTYTNNEVLSLSSSLSNQINEEFVHKSGDTIKYLNVNGQLSVCNNVEIDGNTRIRGSIIQGESVKATEKGGIALGISAEAVHTNSFVWNGNDNIENYQSHGERGTFNINPEQGVNGFYIGEKTLSAIIHNDIILTANTLTTLISAASALVSALVDINRIADNLELSNTLSSYTNSICVELSTQVNNNRVVDKNELSNILSTYSNELWANLSNTISTSKFANYDTFEFNSNTNEHTLEIVLKGNYTDEVKRLSIDTTDFIKNRIVDHVEVVDIKVGETTKKALRIFWSKSDETDKAYTDILIEDLAKIYTAGEGITITDDLIISADYNVLAKTADLIDTRNTVLELSSNKIPTINSQVTTIQNYIDVLSADSTGNHGILWQLSDAITADIANLNELSTNCKSILVELTGDIEKISADVEINKKFDNMLCIMVDDETGQKAVGVLPDIRHDLNLLATEIKHNANFAGTIEICKYHPDWESSGYGNNLSSIFKYLNLAVEDKLKNGNIYEVIFSPEEYDFSNPVFAADQSYTTDDNFTLAHKDWLYIATGDSTTYVPLTALNSTNVKIFPSTRFYQHYQLSNTVFNNYFWLSGGNNDDAEYQISVEINGRTPEIKTIKGHCISGHNHFVQGDNRFDGYNFIEELSTHTISTDLLSGYSLSVEILSVNRLSVEQLSGYSLSVENLSNYYACIDKLSAITMSADWKEVKSNTGYSLADLSTALSNKIWIDDQINNDIPNHTSDLSIIKISKEDYDTNIATKRSIMSANTLYIVESNYIDAYGQAIKNIIMSSDNLYTVAYEPSEATNKNYVDAICADISDTVELSVEELQRQVINNDNDIEFLSGLHDWLSTALSTDIISLSTALSTDIDNLSTALSTDLCAYVKNILLEVDKIYKEVSSITIASDLSDIISTVVYIATNLSNITNVTI